MSSSCWDPRSHERGYVAALVRAWLADEFCGYILDRYFCPYIWSAYLVFVSFVLFVVKDPEFGLNGLENENLGFSACPELVEGASLCEIPLDADTPNRHSKTLQPTVKRRQSETWKKLEQFRLDHNTTRQHSLPGYRPLIGFARQQAKTLKNRIGYQNLIPVQIREKGKNRFFKHSGAIAIL